ncbi:hypothetical protein FPZ43_10885 [Mucilaginibacter pallidiroseus]|uniref:Lipoprotein n=1 Tax=Mucilaginibacter pallidiroseus TaxID=2599295 RepID=A0A563UDK6_9SPHI|nr:membrane lipoprotein lipid attachment site-containing protein [Mucilaginibacter pallidiroseus]TWR29447.1 hypothetical protein FPZ43_10885 [Mucilaginibacter pallidiroseus]
MKKTLCFALVALILSSCNYTTYNMNRGELKIAKKDTYNVYYSTITPNGVKAKVSYVDKDGKDHEEKFDGGRWEKLVQLPSKTAVIFKVDTKLPKTTPNSQLITNIKVDNAVVSEQIQTGKDVKYRFAFKLP